MTKTSIDPVTLAVLQSGLNQVCNEMDLAFVRAAFSPVISEALDRSDGIYHRGGDGTRGGELIAQGELGLPVFVASRPRFRPSEAPMAMVRTTPSPSCCCTSRVSWPSPMISAS
jgi:hypothetical protein